MNLKYSDGDFYVPEGVYNSRTFQRTVIDNQRQIFANAPSRSWIKIHALRTVKDSWQDSLKGFCEKKFGDVWKVSLPVHEADDKKVITFYVSKYLPNLLLFYMASTNRRYENAVRRLIKHTYGLGSMWIAPKKYESLIFHFMDQFKPTVYRFYGIRNANDTTESRIRPSYQRSMWWTAKDSFETMSELKELYGIRPTSIFMQFRYGNFQFTNEGLFVLSRQNREMFDALNESLSFVKRDEEYFSKITQRMKLEYDSFAPRSKKSILIPKLTSGSIRLNKTSLSTGLVQQLMDSVVSFAFLIP